MLNKNRLVEDHVGVKLGWNVAECKDGFFDAVDDCDGIRVTTLFQDGGVDGFLAVDANDVVLLVGAVDGFAHVG